MTHESEQKPFQDGPANGQGRPSPAPRLDAASAGRLLGALGFGEDLGGAGAVGAVAPPGYTFLRELGSGASGTVYLALRAGSERAVSVKVWRDTRRSDRAARAWRELDVLGEFNLPVVPRVLDYGTCDGSLYVTTDYIDGVDPVAFARHHAFNHKARALLLADLCDAVQVLHEHGIIHRDIKPANILVTAGVTGDSRRVFILDMGLALLARRSQDGLTLEGQPVGTLGSMAPEQARGERAKVSVRSDVYSLGAIGYELLCGETPHAVDGGASQTLLRIATSPARRVAEITPDLPAPLAAVLEKSVLFEPSERYASAADFAADLRRWARGERVLATPPRRWQKVMEWVARHPKASTGVACGVMAFVSTGAVFSTLWRLQSKPAFLFFNRSEGDTARLVSVTGNELAVWNTGRKGSLKYTAFVPAKHTGGHGDCVLFVSTTHSKEKYPGGGCAAAGGRTKGKPRVACRGIFAFHARCAERSKW